MYVVNVDDVEKRVLGSHGETAKYQLIFGRGSDHPITKSVTSVWVMTVEPGGTNKPHLHENEEQVYMIVNGEGVVSVGEEKRRVKEGDFIYLPPGITHAFYNDGKRECVIIAFGAKIP